MNIISQQIVILVLSMLSCACNSVDREQNQSLGSMIEFYNTLENDRDRTILYGPLALITIGGDPLLISEYIEDGLEDEVIFLLMHTNGIPSAFGKISDAQFELVSIKGIETVPHFTQKISTVNHSANICRRLSHTNISNTQLARHESHEGVVLYLYDPTNDSNFGAVATNVKLMIERNSNLRQQDTLRQLSQCLAELGLTEVARFVCTS